MAGYPADADFDALVREHLLCDCLIQTADISHAHLVYGPNRNAARGETTRRQLRPAASHHVEDPRTIRRPGTTVDISADVFFVNGIPFFVTKSRRMRFIASEGLVDRFKVTLSASLASVIKLYNTYGY